jgi:hypothetical protein
MDITWSMKRKTAAGWELPPLAELQGRTLRDVLQAEVGKETVAEFIIGDTLNYFCGTEELKKRMSKKGKSVTFSRALEILAGINPALLDEKCPDYHGVADVFPGAQAGAQTVVVEPVVSEQKALF